MFFCLSYCLSLVSLKKRKIMDKRNMFDYARIILENVSFDPELFYKELKKAITHLLPYDVEKLFKWVVGYVEHKPELQESLSLIEE